MSLFYLCFLLSFVGALLQQGITSTAPRNRVKGARPLARAIWRLGFMAGVVAGLARQSELWGRLSDASPSEFRETISLRRIPICRATSSSLTVTACPPLTVLRVHMHPPPTCINRHVKPLFESAPRSSDGAFRAFAPPLPPFCVGRESQPMTSSWTEPEPELSTFGPSSAWYGCCAIGPRNRHLSCVRAYSATLLLPLFAYVAAAACFVVAWLVALHVMNNRHAEAVRRCRRWLEFPWRSFLPEKSSQYAGENALFLPDQ